MLQKIPRLESMKKMLFYLSTPPEIFYYYADVKNIEPFYNYNDGN